MLMYSALTKLLPNSDKFCREADKFSLVSMCTSVLPIRTNRRALVLDCGLGRFADLPLSQEIDDN